MFLLRHFEKQEHCRVDLLVARRTEPGQDGRAEMQADAKIEPIMGGRRQYQRQFLDTGLIASTGVINLSQLDHSVRNASNFLQGNHDVERS